MLGEPVLGQAVTFAEKDTGWSFGLVSQVPFLCRAILVTWKKVNWPKPNAWRYLPVPPWNRQLPRANTVAVHTLRLIFGVTLLTSV